MPWRDDLRGNAPFLLLGVAILASMALLLALGSELTFFQDSWAFLIDRRGDSARDLLAPHNEHIVLIPAAIDKLLVASFGIESAAPQRVVLTLILAATAVLAFVYVRRRVGAWLALFAAVLLLFLGAAWEVLLWPFEISLAGSAGAGIAMLLALERDDRRGDVVACLLLGVSIGFSSLGLAFAAGALVDVFLRRRERGLARIYLAAIPLLLYGAWYLAYGSETESSVSLLNALQSPVVVAGGFSSATAALLGLGSVGGEIGGHAQAFLGFVALLCLPAAFLYLQRRRPGVFARMRAPGVSPRLWPILAAALAFWLLAGFNDRGVEASRYMHIGAIFILLIAADLLQGARLRRPALIGVGFVAIAAAASNLIPLLEGRDHLREETVLARADLASIEIARRTVAADLWLHPDLAGTFGLINVTAGPYLSLVEESGSPAYTPSELARAPEAGRRQADIVLSAALPVRLDSALGESIGTAAFRDGCAELPAGARPDSPGLPLTAGVTLIGVPPGELAHLRLRRYASEEYPVDLGSVAAGSTARLTIPRDRARRPWRLLVEASRPVAVCGPAGRRTAVLPGRPS